MKPRVSVVIPCHNQARFLGEAVESVVRQTYRYFEIIIVNDGSVDDTVKIAQDLIMENGDFRIKLINQENKGLPGARNSGIDAAMGKYILPLDADDMLMPAFLEETVAVLDSMPEVAIAYTDCVLFGDVPEMLKVRKTSEEYNLKNLLDHNFMVCTSLFRKSAWADVGGYKEKMLNGYEDWEFWISLAEAGHIGKLVDKGLFLYRKHGHSMIDDTHAKHGNVVYNVRKLHVRLYYPAISRISMQAALVANFVKCYIRDPISLYLYRNFRWLHTILKNAKYRMKLG